MRAVVLPAPGQSLLVDELHPEPGAGKEGGEIIEVTACGVCHSDLHVVDGDYAGNYPLVLGHEVTGQHAELGAVMVYAPWGCRDCAECNANLEMICSNSTEAGLLIDGGYSERMWVKHRRYLAPLDDLDPVSSAPLACGGLTAYRAVNHGLDILRERGPAGRALVIGAGGLGQFAIRYLRLLSDAHVTALDSSDHKRATALEIGAHAAVSPDALSPDDGPGPADVVIDFVGAQATLTTAASVVAKRGMVAVVGLRSGRIPFGFGAVPHEARFLSSIWGSRSQLDELLDLARREPSIIQPVETLPLTDAQKAHDRLRAGDVRGRIVLVANPTRLPTQPSSRPDRKTNQTPISERDFT
ncbi:MAG: zinc-binding dehydrogenase [Acidimicrobiaceae bacterium]|nr:zinc-binding dehydrogenase [Acidimicrobiaceae bacterium]MYA74903.1 zinc-binding dehydrogenase [Acidimicrobiaceae bacterium]MYD05731.1 zinc-binding dehydrogenase [Acidimicrobiaceae bacterium]MYG56065.1 zinc-binding dehydrogenase [Acidimicrobiaceae bacterium]MYI57756.1 zinc-binding dehydrogenase [Acidimicrobiaceae bacterium]